MGSCTACDNHHVKKETLKAKKSDSQLKRRKLSSLGISFQSVFFLLDCMGVCWCSDSSFSNWDVEMLC